jgi:hypothetical protein
MATRLIDITNVIRSKNSGPYELTLDILFKDRASYERVKQGNFINRELIARLYRVPLAEISSVIGFDPAAAIKVTFKRPVVSGGVGDTDVYGAQQHAPLLDLTLPW